MSRIRIINWEQFIIRIINNRRRRYLKILAMLKGMYSFRVEGPPHGNIIHVNLFSGDQYFLNVQRSEF